MSDSFKAIVEAMKVIKGKLPDNVTPEMYLVKDLGFESIDLVDLSFEVESRLNKSFELNEFVRFVSSKDDAIYHDFTIKMMIDYIEKKG